ncbi:MAG: hypothetical protein JSW48_16870 [Betaproteobacteria bacterium]|nr:MAG: hypothetical protein JSW48_16870 [Betaproteobacteria bacterium]
MKLVKPGSSSGHPLASMLQSIRLRAFEFDREARSVLSTLTPLRPSLENAPPPDASEIAQAVAVPLLKAEVEALPEEQRLVCSVQFLVVYARAAHIPWCLQEIGRLRELAFRAVGEGTGKATGIDLYDAYYLHLFIWDVRPR